MEFAGQLRRTKTEELLALKLHKSSIKGVNTAGDVLSGATEQAREYARGWTKDRAQSLGPLPQLDLYAAVAFGPAAVGDCTCVVGAGRTAA